MRHVTRVRERGGSTLVWLALGGLFGGVVAVSCGPVDHGVPPAPPAVEEVGPIDGTDTGIDVVCGLGGTLVSVEPDTADTRARATKQCADAQRALDGVLPG